MVDWTLGLTLTEREQDIIQSAYASFPENGRSLNQVLSFVKDIPLICDFEIKREHSNIPPQFQIGVWIGASYLKRKLHGWDTKIPMLGVCVCGSSWLLYILYETKDDTLVRSDPQLPVF